MAVILVEGFDHFDASVSNEKFWIGYVPGFTRTDTGREPGGSCMVVQHLFPLTHYLTSAYSELIVGAAFKLSGLTNPFMYLQAGDGSTIATLGVSGGTLLVTDAAARTFSGTTPINDDEWFQAELKVDIAGTFELQLNGATEIGSTGGSFGPDDIRKIEFAHAGSLEGATTRIDDLYVADTTGSPPQNDFLGDVMVKTLWPVADGTYTDWTPLTGTLHYPMVNERMLDGDTTYNYDQDIGDKDSFHMQAIGVIAPIYACQFNVAARKNAPGLREVAPFVRQAGTDYDGPTWAVSTDWLIRSWMLQDDPTSTGWTAEVLNSDEYGVEVIG